MKKKIILIVIAAALTLSAAVSGSFYLGYKKGFSETKNIEIKGVADINPDEKVSADFSVFWQAWDKLKSNHVKGKEIKDQDLLYGSIKGLTESFDDPHTVFFDPEDAKKFEEDINGYFGGIGAELEQKDKKIMVVAPLKNTPAERAGLKPKDVILKVDDKDLTDLSVYEAVKLIRGEPETKVKLLISRQEFKEPKIFEITREIIHVPTLEWKMLDDGVIYLQLYNFNQEAPLAFYQMAIKTSFGNAKGMILDLRNNPGGYLDVAIDIAGWFLKNGEPVVIEKMASGKENTLRSRGNGFLSNLPTVILINEGSASASEILAGALRDKRGIKLVGEKSFGKGTVQELEELKDGSSLKITIANWLTPNGKVIDKNGLEPDYKIPLVDKDVKEKKDPQLEKALEIIKSELAGKSR